MAELKITWLVLNGIRWVEVSQVLFLCIMKKTCERVTFYDGMSLYTDKDGKAIGMMICKEV